MRKGSLQWSERAADATEKGGRLLGDFGEKALRVGHDSIQRAEEVIVRHIGPWPAPDLLLQIELGCIAGQWHEHNLRAVLESGQRALGLVAAGPIDDQKDEVRLGIGGDDLTSDELLEVEAALLSAQLEMRLPAAAGDRSEHHLLAVVTGRLDLPGHTHRRPDPGAGGVERQVSLIHIQHGYRRLVGVADRLRLDPANPTLHVSKKSTIDFS